MCATAQVSLTPRVPPMCAAAHVYLTPCAPHPMCAPQVSLSSVALKMSTWLSSSGVTASLYASWVAGGLRVAARTGAGTDYRCGVAGFLGFSCFF